MLYGRFVRVGKPRASQVLILIFLENALRLFYKTCFVSNDFSGLNPYFFGKCSTAEPRFNKSQDVI